MSNSVRPHRQQSTRLPHPWDSPGKNIGVGWHFLLQCMKVKMKSLSRVRLFATPWTAAYQAPPSMGFSRQEYWSGVPSPSLSYLASPAQNATVQTVSHLMFKRENICVWSKSEGRRAPLSFGCKATVHGLEMSALPLTAWIFLNKLFDLSVLQNLNL